jgi:uncharacterized RDD family membrane protein YckC
MFESGHDASLPHPVRDARFYAGVPLRRVIAFVIDTVATVVLGLVVALAIGLATLGAGLLAFVPVMGATGFLYRVLSLARWSATPGMLATGIEFRRRDGRSFDLPHAFLHTALFVFCMLTGALQVISAGLMAVTPTGRGLPDMALGSVVIHRPV